MGTLRPRGSPTRRSAWPTPLPGEAASARLPRGTPQGGAAVDRHGPDPAAGVRVRVLPDGARRAAAGGFRSACPAHRVYGTGMAIDPTGTVDEIVRTAVACGFDVEGWGSEFDASAYEVNIRYRDAMEAADDAFVFRLLSHELPARRGLLATYLGRPLNDRGGTGLHLNFSFRRAEDGTNALHDPDTSDGLSKLAHQCIAGMLGAPRGAGRHLRADGERVQAAAARHAERLLGQLGLRRPVGGHPDRAGPRPGDAAGEPGAGRRGQPVPDAGGDPARGAVRDGARAGAAARAAGRRGTEHGRPHPGDAGGRTGGVPGGQGAVRGARARTW